MSLTRVHFKEIAAILGRNHASQELVEDFTDFCYAQNDRFDAKRFREAIESAAKETGVKQ